MSASEEVEFSLKVVMNKENSKVFFAEVDNDFADVLLSFLTLPLGTIVRLLVKHFGDQSLSIGSLNTLYEGLSGLESSHFWTDTAKKILLNARNSLAFLCQKLKVNLDDSQPTEYFKCGNGCYCQMKYIVMNRHDVKCKYSGLLINSKVILKSSYIQTSCDGGVFTKGAATFLITDDLQVVPNSTGSCMQILNNLGVKDMDELEERTYTFRLIEIMGLLKASLLSRTPLTDLILHKRLMVSTNTASSQLHPSLPQIRGALTNKKLIVKVIVRKSTSKVVLAQADEKFIDFLFSLLTIPLGRVIYLLDNNTSVGSVDNLYRSISNLDSEMYLKTEELKSLLLKPLLPPEYLSENQIFSHTEDITSVLPVSHSHPCFEDLKGKHGYVKGPAMFMVTDDLVVTPLSATSSLSVIKKLKVPLCDIEELQLEIGMEEALNILKASLTSASALTNGLQLVSKRQVKQET